MGSFCLIDQINGRCSYFSRAFLKNIIDFAMMEKELFRKRLLLSAFLWRGEFCLEKKKWRLKITDVLLLLASGVFFIGMRTFLAPCAQQADGKWMVCHWAGEALFGVAAVLFAIALLHAVIWRAAIKTGLAMAMIPTAVLAFFLPGQMIDLCMMETMRCHTVMQPAARAISAVLILLACLDVYCYRKGDDR